MFPRVACTLVCTVANVGSGRVLNVSDGGAFVALPDQHAHLPSQLQLSVALLGSDQAVDVSARVVRVAALSPHGLGVGLQFQDLSEAAAEQIHRYVLGRLLAEIAEIMEDQPRHVDPRNVQVVSGVASVANTLRDMLAEGPVPGMLLQRDVGELVDLQLFQVSGAAILVQLRDAAARLPASRRSRPLHLDARHIQRSRALAGARPQRRPRHPRGAGQPDALRAAALAAALARSAGADL